MKNINFSLFYKYNLFFTIFLYLLFMLHNSSYNILSFILVAFGSISSAIILATFLYIIFYLFAFKNNIILYIVGSVFVVFYLGIILDFFIYKIYNFHINMMVLNIIFSPEAIKSLQFGYAPILLFIIFAFGLIIFELLLIKNILKNQTQNKATNNKINRFIILPFILIFLVEKIGYGISEINNKSNIVSKFVVIPLYLPFTFNRIAYKYFGYKKDVVITNNISKSNKINYPLNKIRISDNPNKINIFIIASDSVQNKYVTKETAPNLMLFKKDSIALNNHFSGGNATRFGIFSLIYGLNSTYWFNFLHANRGAIIFDVLKKLDYKISIISSQTTRWPEFRKTCYVKVQDSILDKHEGAPWELDKQSFDEFIDMLNSKDDRPIFSFVFFDAPHGYSYPASFNKFDASGENINYLMVQKGGDEIKSAKARYKNSIYYNDYLFGKMIKKLKELNLYDNSLVIFTSDHGQEFYEYGYFGHGSSFSRAQTNVPMIIKLPKSLKNKLNFKDTYHFTSHVDIVPTILSIIGVKNPTSDYSNGYNLFDKNYIKNRDYIYSANDETNAIITTSFVYNFSNFSDKMFQNIIRKTDSFEVAHDAKIDTKLILKVMDENRRFIK